MNSVVHISKIMSVQSYSRFHHFWMCLTHWGQNKNGGQFTIIFKPIYSNEKKIYLIQISLKYFPKVPINNMPVLVQIMAWCQPGYNPPSGGRFKNTYELLNLRALKISKLHKNHIFQCMGKIFCVEFQRVPLKFHTKYLTHTLKDVDFIHIWKFKSSLI